MASQKPPLTVIRSPAAIDELNDIWRWNAERYSLPHADEYLLYLTDSIADLSHDHLAGKTISARPNLRYILVRRRASGHGHVVAYRFDDKEVRILHIFHTAQDWENKLQEEMP